MWRLGWIWKGIAKGTAVLEPCAVDLKGLADFSRHYPTNIPGKRHALRLPCPVTEPDILLMDEPLRALDAQSDC
jgi:ABC-type nitrate/sulfonate/bicarbonate transport system ATPase subunit